MRQVSLYKNRQIVIKDSIEFEKGGIGDNEYFLSLMTYDTPVISENRIALGDSNIEFLKDVILSYEEIPIEDEKLKKAWKHNIYRIIVLPKTSELIITVS